MKVLSKDAVFEEKEQGKQMKWHNMDANSVLKELEISKENRLRLSV